MSRARKLNVVPDRLDVRDRPYQPEVSICPPSFLFSWENRWIPDRDQGETGACTGFALATVVDFLLQEAGRDEETPVSAFMMYSMARRYDDIDAPQDEDTGSSVRAALKGWFRHGVCAESLWETFEKPATPTHGPDWWQDAANRPLGAYYRVDSRSVTDMQVALNEVGVLYASAVCHTGWDTGFTLKKKARADWTIPIHPASDDDPGHAFVIVGYDAAGFFVLNSWGRGWGDDGFARLRYEDWLESAMDCWVVQLGVVTEQHRAVASARTLRTDHEGHVTLAPTEELRNKELTPLIVDVQNDGRLSRSGRFRTTRADLDAIWRVSLPAFVKKKRKKIGKGPIDIALYAHGGLVGEKDAAKTAAKWIPGLYDAGVFPIFFMWETDLFSTLKNEIADTLADAFGVRRPTAGLRDQIQRFLNRRIEGLLAGPGTRVWAEMKENADLISAHDTAGGVLLYEASRGVVDPADVRLHLIGHSAGSILHAHLLDRLVGVGLRFESVSFMAPAARVDLFEECVVPHLESGAVKRYRQLHLSKAAEARDPTCRPILGYGRSLLYLVSRSFERGITTPILGLEESFTPMLAGLPRAARERITHAALPGPLAQVTTHGGFDDDDAVMADVIAHIRS